MNTLGTNLKTHREEKKLKQSEVAEKINISQNTYSRYETGDREPNIDILIRLADIFNESIDVLVGRYIKNK